MITARNSVITRWYPAVVLVLALRVKSGIFVRPKRAREIQAGGCQTTEPVSFSLCSRSAGGGYESFLH
jgi:hypothetical protein